MYQTRKPLSYYWVFDCLAPGEQLTRDEIQKQVQLKDETLLNALHLLRADGLVTRDEGQTPPRYHRTIR